MLSDQTESHGGDGVGVSSETSPDARDVDDAVVRRLLSEVDVVSLFDA